MSSVKIERARGLTRPIRLTWKDPSLYRLDSVTGISLQVYDEDKTTLIETLTGEVRNFDPAVWFPIIDTDWVGIRYCRLVLNYGAETDAVPDLIHWIQN